MKLIRQDSSDERWRAETSGPQWIDLDLDEANIDRWLSEKLDLCEETQRLVRGRSKRNRRVVVPEGIFLRVCCLTLSPTAESAEATTQFGVLIHADRIVTLRRGRVLELEAVWDFLKQGTEPAESVWHVLALIVMKISGMVEANLDSISEQVDDLEDILFVEDEELPIDYLGQIRRHLIRERRYLTMLACTVEDTISDTQSQLAIESGKELHFAAQELGRQVRTLEFFVERTNLIQDQIESELSERLNRATYRLGVVATVFLPLGFLTGLLGINVAGVPGDHYPGAFWLVCGVLFVIAMVAWYVVARTQKA
jgi:zinc transporter